MSELIKTSLHEVIHDPVSGSRPKGGVTLEGEIPSFGGENITMLGGINFYPVKKISIEFFESMKRGHLSDLDVLINKDGANTGKSSIYRSSPYTKASVNEHLFILRGIDGKLDQVFLHFLLQSPEVKRVLESKITGSAQPGLNSTFSKNFPIALVSYPEQKKIASILTSVDEVIENLQKQIDKLQDLKKATMNELLTKGIGHTEFKNSELGRIPKSWKVLTISESEVQLLDGDRGKHYPKEQDLKSQGYCLFLSAKNVTKGGFIFEEKIYISKEKHRQMKKGTIDRGDIVITTRGTIGNLAYFDKKITQDTIRINSGMAIIRNLDKKLNTQFLFLVLNSELIKHQERFLTYGSAQPQLTLLTLRELKIPTPIVNEQLDIFKVVDSLSSAISKKHEKLKKNQSLKKSLMQDLLTGEVRIAGFEK